MEERETCAAVATEGEGSVDGGDMDTERNVAVRGGPPAARDCAQVGMRSWRARREESFARRLLHHSLSPAFPGQIAPFQELPFPSSNPDASFRPPTALLSFFHQPRCASPVTSILSTGADRRTPLYFFALTCCLTRFRYRLHPCDLQQYARSWAVRRALRPCNAPDGQDILRRRPQIPAGSDTEETTLVARLSD